MRRILRKIAAGNPNDLGDISTLADPLVVDAIVRSYENKMEAIRCGPAPEQTPDKGSGCKGGLPGCH
jgi:hypothetical protein